MKTTPDKKKIVKRDAPAPAPKITDPDNQDQAIFTDINGEADDEWREAMMELFPALAQAQQEN